MALLGLGFSYIYFSILHVFLFALGVTICGLYGTDLHKAQKEDKYADSKWVYAVVVGALTALTALLSLVPFILRIAFIWAWDLVLFVLSIALFGLFGNMYIREDPEGNAGIQRMKNAVWVDLAVALLWLITTLSSVVYWWRHRERQSRFTGRAKV